MNAFDLERRHAGDASPPDPEARWLGGFPVLSLTRERLAEDLLDALAAGRKRQVFFANTNFVVQCQPLRELLRIPTVRVVNDGIGMDIASWMVHGRRFPDNLNGTDFIPFLARRSARPLRFFLFGARPDVAERAGRRLVEHFGQQVVGTCDGYDGRTAAGDTLVDTINASGADIVLVAFGNPAQEAWVLDHCAACDAPLMFGVGALLDFLSGNARRAPPWVRAMHLEWLFRLVGEPRRLLKRYTVDLVTFFRICLRAGRSR